MLNGRLYAQDFLLDGITRLPEWAAISDGAIAEFQNSLKAIYKPFLKSAGPKEGVTEQDCIYKIISLLKWEYLTQQVAAERARDVPDALLFASAEEKGRAATLQKQQDRYRLGLAILENKARDMPLDRATGREEAPSTQILRYLTTAEIQSDRKIRWGLLTDGCVWRLYFAHARSRSEDFLEIDLPAVLKMPGRENLFVSAQPATHWLKVFLLFFNPGAFTASGPEASCLHDRALTEGRLWEARVAKTLSDLVFNDVFPLLVNGLYENDDKRPARPDDAYLMQVKQAALVLLYRLLFLLYAEDRDLLPASDNRYDDYGLRKPVRDEIARRVDTNDTFSEKSAKFFNHLKELFGIVGQGDASLGIPPYNGGLFSAEAAPVLERSKLPDSVMAVVIDTLARREEGGRKVYINYRDLSVQQLGSIYERLLEYDIKLDEGHPVVAPNIFARKGSGSYYTPDELVRLIIERAIGPLINEKLEAFEALLGKATEAKGKIRKADLEKQDPASAILELKICDPAMGSGHFLVSMVDYLADRILVAMSWAENTGAEHDYVSPLAARIEAIREHILAAAEKNGWVVKETQLEDRMLVRRMILKRVTHGVDKNPMAVELAKVALWLHTFTVGAPLSFLDHHLRCGDSLFGSWVNPVMSDLASRGGLLLHTEVTKLRTAAAEMGMVENLTDADITEVRQSAGTFADISKRTAPLDRLLTLYHALKWAVDDGRQKRLAVKGFFEGTNGDPLPVLMGSAKPSVPKKLDGQSRSSARMAAVAEAAGLFPDLLARAEAIAEEQKFLNWQVAFPNVWTDWESAELKGGFDAVIGNPPWDRIKLQEVEWFAARKPEIAMQQRASDRKKMIAALERAKDPLARDYAYAAGMAEAASRVARAREEKGRGDYPLLSGGDTNLYSLFVERASRLVNARGIVGLLVPSGIASDLGASEFFRSVATTGRLAALIDFENRRGRGSDDFFPDVHSCFKFCIFAFGGRARKFNHTDCAFFVHDPEELNDAERRFTLTADDFSTVNPNTGTAPIFRRRRDAELTKRIYARHPVLVRREGDKETRLYPVKYFRMFDMTNDAGLFKKREELEKEGFYPVEGNRLKKGEAEYVPLYVGKMIWHFDHRASSVSVSQEAIHVAAGSDNTTIEQHEDQNFYPAAQFWVPTKEIRWNSKTKWLLGFRDITNPTNARTAVSAIIPYSGVNNKLPLLLPVDKTIYAKLAPILLANINAFCFDYVARQKIQSTSLNWYIFEQLPFIKPETFKTKKIGKVTAEEIIRDEVRTLTYTANDMAPFAKDMGYDGPPFKWDEEDRRHRMARLDALFFILYGLNRDEADYVLSTFPIVKKHDEEEFGRYLTRDLILGYMAAFEAGDSESRVSLGSMDN